MKLLALLVAVACATVARAQTNNPQPFKTNDVVTITNAQGKVFKEVKLVAIKPNSAVYVLTDGAGGGVLAFTNLTETTKAQFGFNQARAAHADEADQIKAESNREKQRQVAMAARVRARQIAILRTAEVVNGKVVQIIKDGVLVNRDCGISHNDEITMGIDYAPHVHQTVLVKDVPKQLSFASGDPITIAVYPVGTYTYTTVGNAESTVHAYTCSKYAAIANDNPVPSHQQYYEPIKHVCGPDVYELPK